MAAKWAKLLLGCYRTGDANDPEVYTAAVVAVLSDYPEDVVAHVCDPRRGLPATNQWLPTVAEVRLACENRAHRLASEREREQRIERQLSERELEERREAESKASGERDRIATSFAKLSADLHSRHFAEDEAKRKAAQLATIQRANERVIAAMGGDPAAMASPILRKLLQEPTP